MKFGRVPTTETTRMGVGLSFKGWCQGWRVLTSDRHSCVWRSVTYHTRGPCQAGVYEFLAVASRDSEVKLYELARICSLNLGGSADPGLRADCDIGRPPSIGIENGDRGQSEHRQDE